MVYNKQLQTTTIIYHSFSLLQHTCTAFLCHQRPTILPLSYLSFSPLQCTIIAFHLPPTSYHPPTLPCVSPTSSTASSLPHHHQHSASPTSFTVNNLPHYHCPCVPLVSRLILVSVPRLSLSSSLHISFGLLPYTSCFTQTVSDSVKHYLRLIVTSNSFQRLFSSWYTQRECTVLALL